MAGSELHRDRGRTGGVLVLRVLRDREVVVMIGREHCSQREFDERQDREMDSDALVERMDRMTPPLPGTRENNHESDHDPETAARANDGAARKS